MKRIVLLLIIQSAITTVFACYNETHITKDGKTSSRSDPMHTFYNEPDKRSATEFLNKYDLSKPQQYDKDVQSDIAVNLAYLGRYEEALAILEPLQKKFPDDYNIAANLGTTYELVGKNELALRFIRKGIELNPDSHDGSEWVHVKILEAKLQLAKDPSWLNTHRVLQTGVTFQSAVSETLDEKADDVEYQLQERVPFTPFPDKILANVFDELGDLYATQQSVELAYIAYDFSLQYDPADLYGVKSKMEQLVPVLRKNKIPIPSWQGHYYNRVRSQLQSDIAMELIETVLGPDKKKSASNQGSLTDKLEDDKYSKERRRRNQLFLFGGLGVAVLLTALVVYKARKMP
ncbi:MAG: tetratricopeptide repeat protein [Chitinophagaceae bacterium]|nr:tetratricopeptide repeat protein [Chitinophagaceae bacterium]